MDILSLKGKSISSNEVTIYPSDHKEAIKLYGNEAKEGVMVISDAKVFNKEEVILNKPQVDTVPKKEKDNQVFTKLEVAPQFNGDWGKFLQQNINPEVPLNYNAPAGQYTVIAQFIVDKEGNISDLKTITKLGYGMEEEVLRVMKLSPNWIPGLQRGKKVTAYRKQPITFVVSEDDEQIMTATDKLYIGIDNPIKLNFGQAKPQDLLVTISQGSIINKGALYLARVNVIKPVTTKVFIKENGQIRELGSRTFAADVIQDKEEGEKIMQQIKNF